MKITKNINEINSLYNEDKIQITIGNFDGVHLGHREFLARIKSDCKINNCKFVVITFIPHPTQILKAQSGFLINTFLERRELLASCGVDYLLEVDFTRDFSTLNPEDFLQSYVFSCKGIDKIYLGHDFMFGANKTGGYRLAKDLCEKEGVVLVLQDEFRLNNHAVSSSAIRLAISGGDIEEATALLGRNYFLSGRVIRGQGRGRQIGFPTANIGFSPDLILPQRGVYITQTKIHEMVYQSVTNIGFNPTFNATVEVSVETHVLGFNRDIYGEEVVIIFLKKLREEKKFGTVNDLIAQIHADILLTESFFSFPFDISR